MTMIILISTFFINASALPQAFPATDPSKNLSLKGGKTIMVTGVHFTGNKGVSSTQLQYLARSFLNRTLAESDLFELKQRILLLYQSKGFKEVKMTMRLEHKGSILHITIEEEKLYQS
jgi:hemolysin activation/secretion protein